MSADGRMLPMRGTQLSAEAHGGIARVLLRQRFVNPYDEPLAVRYQVPLPADGAVSDFAFELGARRIVGEIDKRERARERFEEAIVEGCSAALLEQDRSSLFTQDVGNIPAGEQIVAELVIDQKLRWLTEGRWEWRFPTVVAPRYQGAPGRAEDASKLSVDVAAGELPQRAELMLHIEDALPEGARPESTSHPIAVVDGEVRFRDESGARLDRDVVVSWPVAGDGVRTALSVARPAAGHPCAAKVYGLLTLVPPAVSATRREEAVARDLILLIDSSGSMHGEPLDQARRVALALVDSLGEQDSLQMIDFNDKPRKWRRKAVSVTETEKRAARKWLEKLSAGGATEMRDGILAALEPLRDGAQRQVVLLSDGLIGSEHEIVGAIVNELPAGSRVHAVGVGSAVNRSLTAPAARAGRGLEAILGIGDDPERVAQRLVARTAAPLVVDLEVDGSAVDDHAPQRLPDLYAGAPALVSLQLSPEGGTLTIRGRTPQFESKGRWVHEIEVLPTAHATGDAAIIKLYAREMVEDLDTGRAAMHAGHGDVDREVERLGLEFQIATRMTSWVAVSEERTVDPTEPSRRETIPHELPYGMSVEKLGLRMHAASTALPPVPESPAGLVDSLELSAAMRRARRGRRFATQPLSARTPMAKSASELQRFLQAATDELEAKDELDETMDAIGAPSPRQPLRGRVVLLRDDTLTVDLEAQAAMRWDPSDAVLVLADGSRLSVAVVDDKTTRSGDVPAGCILRLTVRWENGPLAETVDRIQLMCDGSELAIQL